VKINACGALGVPPVRGFYGSRYIKIINILTQALIDLDRDTSDAMTFQYKDSLHENVRNLFCFLEGRNELIVFSSQLMKTFSHMISLANETDEGLLGEIFATRDQQIISILTAFVTAVEDCQRQKV